MAWRYVFSALRLLGRSDLKPSAKLLLVVLADEVADDGRRQLDLKKLMSRCGLSDRGVQLATSELVSLGLLSVDRRHNHHNRYRLRFEPKLDPKNFRVESDDTPDSDPKILRVKSDDTPDSDPKNFRVEDPKIFHPAPEGSSVRPEDPSGRILDPYSLLGGAWLSDSAVLACLAALKRSSADGRGVERLAFGTGRRAACEPSARLISLARDALHRVPASLVEIEAVGSLVGSGELFGHRRVLLCSELLRPPSKHREDWWESAILTARSPSRQTVARLPSAPPSKARRPRAAATTAKSASLPLSAAELDAQRRQLDLLAGLVTHGE